ncbi:Rz1 family lipoprotein [Escherichia coli]|nr:Rz1 family lipoprotein [Escherichia coli]MCB6834219.1 Rz1 family lipoprotein [Escherichia coli]MCB8740583.1 Rz1 family lipoprotein [Escherichia coli]MCJ2704017.1 Rz1 family lipoprotein [Escherichia coli]MCN2566129.1 Rz1 family lipoprotein [Escherichia coli]
MPLVVSACVSTPPVQVPCVKPPVPPAWIMQPAPNWQTPLNGIISSSENG